MSSSSIETSLFTFLSPHTSSRISAFFIFYLIWSAIWVILYSRPTSERVVTKAQKQKHQSHRLERQELATRMVAFLHAALVGLGSASLLFYRSDSPLYVRSLTDWKNWPNFDAHDQRAIFYASASVGFFVADFMLTVILLEENGIQFVVHAIAAGSGSLWTALNDRGEVYLMLLMLFEMSTPFLHMRWFLLEYGYKKTKFFIINGLLLVFFFTLCRIVIGFPVIAKLIYELHLTPLAQRETPTMRWFFTFAGLAMCVLNTVWGFKLWVGLFKAVGLISEKKKHVVVAHDNHADQNNNTEKDD
jgi:hypothetical protein